MAYLLDTNVFIQAKNLHYGFDFCPAFWEWIERENVAGKVFSIERVGDEIKAGEDELAAWISERADGLLLKPDQSMLGSLPTVSEWAGRQGYSSSAVNVFLQVADYYLVAQALARGDTVVTHEVASPSLNKIKIPNACIGLGIKCVSTYEMLRLERARFVLGKASQQSE